VRELVFLMFVGWLGEWTYDAMGLLEELICDLG
jgi:hypothetical protein